MATPRDPGTDLVAERIREARRRSGLSLRALSASASSRLAARSAGLRLRSPGVSASYLSLIENGRKVPDEATALAIAEALGDDPDLYRAWVALRKRAALGAALAAARALEAAAERPIGGALPPATGGSGALAAAERPIGGALPRARSGGDPPGGAGRPIGDALDQARSGSDAPAPARFARLRVPVIAEGDDPGPGLRPAVPVLGSLRLDLHVLAGRDRARLDRPVAWRVGPEGARHVPDRFASGSLALVLRDFLPLGRDDAHAVRHAGRVELRRLMWNRRWLVLMPAPGRDDFALLEAGSEDHLRSIVLGAAIPVEGEVHAP